MEDRLGSIAGFRAGSSSLLLLGARLRELVELQHLVGRIVILVGEERVALHTGRRAALTGVLTDLEFARVGAGAVGAFSRAGLRSLPLRARQRKFVNIELCRGA